MTGLRGRLLRWLLFPLLALWSIGLVLEYRIGAETAERAYDDALANTAKALASLVTLEGDVPVLRLSARTEVALRTDKVDQVFFAVFRDHGQRIAGDPVVPFIHAPEGDSFSDLTVAGRVVRLIAVRHVVGTHTVVVEVAETLGKRKRLQAQRALFSAGPNLLIVLLVLVVVGYGVSVGLKPLDHLRQVVVKRSPRDLTPLPLDNVPAELLPLIEALNRQFAMLSASVARQDRFVSDAAHQLKTPLAILQSQLELAAHDDDPASRKNRLEEMEVATRRASHLVRQLLALARAEPDALAVAQRQPVRLAELAESVAQSHLDMAIERGIDLGFELDDVVVQGVPWLLAELLANLVDNALTHVAAGGSVTVRCGIRNKRPFLEVEDNGPGIEPELRERVFERFYQVPGSRGDGCGLGLAIVHDIAAGHGGTVELRSGADGRGACFTVYLVGGTGFEPVTPAV